jgi:hypothetical protein
MITLDLNKMDTDDLKKVINALIVNLELQHNRTTDLQERVLKLEMIILKEVE